MNIPFIILAAGASSRMGSVDKLMQPVDGMPLLARQVRLACAVTQGPVIVALPPAPHPRYGALAGLTCHPCPVPNAEEGMNASLRRAVSMVPDDAPAAALLLGDLPDLTETDLRTVLCAVDFSQKNLIWRGATEDGKPGHPVVFHRDLFPALCALTGDGGAQDLAQRHREKTRLIPLPGSRARADLDTPSDWADWRARNPDR